MGNSFWKQSEDFSHSYKLEEILGRGSFGKVCRCVHKSTKAEFAVKMIKKRYVDPKALAKIKDEVRILEMIHHPNVVRLEEVYESEDCLFIVLELLRGGELFDRIAKKKSFSEYEAAQVIRDVASAVQYMHSIGIVHRDLKPENLVYSSKEQDGVLKITDFGLAKYLGLSRHPRSSLSQYPSENKDEHNSSPMNSMISLVGTLGYMAPEILNREQYGPQVDLWSIGVILFVLLCGYPPFYDRSPSGLLGAIRKGAYCFADPYWTHISEDAKYTIFRLLTVHPQHRITTLELLQTPWILQSHSHSSSSIEIIESPRAFQSDFKLRLAAFNIRRKIRRALFAILAVRRFATNVT
jgi:calcium/calmodulin-dependent protein kinase I